MSWEVETVDARGFPRHHSLEGADRREALATLSDVERRGVRRAQQPAERAPSWVSAAADTAGDLRALVRAGYPLGDALRALADAEGETLERDLAAAAQAAREGATLAESLGGGASPLASEPVRRMLATGEHAGRLPEALAAVERLLGRVHVVRARVLDAVDYPLLLVPVAALLVAITVHAGGPTWQAVQAQVPGWPTSGAARWLVALSQAPGAVWLGVAVVAAATLLLRRALARALERWPLAGAGPLPPPRPLRQAMICQSLAAQVEAGTPAPEAWELLGALVQGAGGRLAEGASLGQALREGAGLKDSEAVALDHATGCGPAALADELWALAEARERRFVAHAESVAWLLEWLLLGAVGAGTLAVAADLLLSSAWLGF